MSWLWLGSASRKQPVPDPRSQIQYVHGRRVEQTQPVRSAHHLLHAPVEVKIFVLVAFAVRNVVVAFEGLESHAFDTNDRNLSKSAFSAVGWGYKPKDRSAQIEVAYNRSYNMDIPHLCLPLRFLMPSARR